VGSQGSGVVPSSSDDGSGSGASSSQPSDSGGSDRAGGRNGEAAGNAAPDAPALSASGDLWSAFDSDRASSLTPSGGGAVAADSGPGAGFGLGLAMLGLGAVALLGGLAFVGARRRRSLATTDDR